MYWDGLLSMGTVHNKSNYYNLILRRNAQKKNGEYPVNIRLKVDSLIKIYATKVAVQEEHWDEKKCVVKRSDPLFFTKNETLSEKISRAEKIILRLEMDGEVSFKNFENEFVTKDTLDEPAKSQPKACFFQYAENFIDLNQSKWAKEHVRNYRTIISKLRKYKEEVYIEDFDLSFLANYEKYMRETLNNASNTVHKTMKFMKPIISAAVLDGVVEKNPFDNYNVKKAPTNRDFLSLDELQRLEKLQDTIQSNKKMHNVLCYFLFACYTGLRYSDLQELCNCHIIENNRIELVQHKTQERVIIPLSKKALKLLPADRAYQDMRAFKVLSNQKTNDYLKCIAVAAGIDKTITCHLARHSNFSFLLKTSNLQAQKN